MNVSPCVVQVIETISVGSTSAFLRIALIASFVFSQYTSGSISTKSVLGVRREYSLDLKSQPDSRFFRKRPALTAVVPTSRVKRYLNRIYLKSYLKRIMTFSNSSISINYTSIFIIIIMRFLIFFTQRFFDLNRLDNHPSRNIDGHVFLPKPAVNHPIEVFPMPILPKPDGSHPTFFGRDFSILREIFICFLILIVLFSKQSFRNIFLSIQEYVRRAIQ